MTDIVLLRQNVHGMAIQGFETAVRERLPDHEVTVARTPADERRAVRDATVATGIDVDTELLDVAEELRLFASVYAGYDHLPLAALAARDVTVTTASGVHGPNVAEHVIGAILAFGRRFLTARRRQRNREWRSLQSRELAGATVAVVGLGAIGRAVVDRLDTFDAHTVGVRYSPAKGGPTDEVFGFDEIHAAVADAEYVVLACPLTDETEHLVDRELLTTMRPDAVLVNVARGRVVDTDALLDAMERNHLRGAALDVTDPEPLPREHPLWTFEDVFITPHSAGHTPAYFERVAEILATNVRKAEETGNWDGLENQVSLEEGRADR